MTRLARGGVRRFGVTFGRGVLWAIGGSWRAWRKALAAPSSDAGPVPRPAADANGDKYCVSGTPQVEAILKDRLKERAHWELNVDYLVK